VPSAKCYRIVWAPSAIQDLDELVGDVALREGAAVASRICTRIRERIDTLSAHPARCRSVPETREVGISEYRELIVAPYRIFFRVTKQTVGLIGILDGRRDLAELLVNRALDD